MKNIGIFLLCIITSTCFAQSYGSLFLEYLGPKPNIALGYAPTPFITTVAQADQKLLQSTDGGITWQDLSNGLPNDIQVNTCFIKDGGVYLGTRGGKVYHNANPGTGSWVLQKLKGKPEKEGSVTKIFDCTSGIYVGIYEQGIYQLIPGTDTWKPVFENIGIKSIFDFVETSNGNLIVAGENGVYRSTDEGKTWKQVYTDGWANSLTYGSNVILANTIKGLMRTVDNGEHWELVVEETGGVHSARFIDSYFIAIRYSYQTRGNWVSISKDNGVTWQMLYPDGPADYQVTDIDKIGEYFFSSRTAGISRSKDQGQTWQLLLSLPSTDGLTLFEMVVSNTTLFAFMRNGGC